MANVAIDSDSAVINAVNFTEQGSDPTAPATSHWKLYFKSSGVWYEKSDSATKQLVTAISLTMPAEFSVGGSPAGEGGTLAVSKANQNANLIYSGPSSGGAAAPTFRYLVPADYPTFIASGASHAAGAVPDPGSSAGTSKYLREDASFDVPPNTTITSEVQGSDFKATGISGATSATRYVGATTSGAPVAGTFLLGDFVIAQNGHVWVCTTAGTPGTWTDAGAAGGMANPMTAQYDVIYGGSPSGGVAPPTRLAAGTNGTFLGVSGGVLGYYTPSGTLPSAVKAAALTTAYNSFV